MTKRNYLKSISVGVIALGTLAIGLTAVLPMSVVRATDANAVTPVSYTHLTLPTNHDMCRSRWSPYH